MRFLLDTHILIWAAGDINLLPHDVRLLIEDGSNDLLFSPASIWEIAIKHGLGRDDFRTDPFVLRYRLLENGYIELPINSEHAIAIAGLPLLHKDPFDRILIAQAIIEGVVLITVDDMVLRYPGLPKYPLN
ncbi:type II toxin-antitoxin system VapC family toxin [Rhizobium sp. Root483D2]|jgi:PIN domain nuclease of toxin-antitoxin system|uniref:type II toxin-antitoxin system VapC family toxin n=1 Tax=Rhizobium sp. Root483D2 TaxID=1736545 RepID=UPI000712D2FF|nr:type II toxin-antitoxin system VapC family toxin [Rhizobium sp. Root483D2]KQY33890.1 twitching motility protein PilT [Rhizobium sp. Root483D2]